MELAERVSEALAPFIDVSWAVNRFETDTGKHFSTFLVNRRGTVLQFLAPYPSMDEDYNDEFVKEILNAL